MVFYFSLFLSSFVGDPSPFLKRNRRARSTRASRSIRSSPRASPTHKMSPRLRLQRAATKLSLHRRFQRGVQLMTTKARLCVPCNRKSETLLLSCSLLLPFLLLLLLPILLLLPRILRFLRFLLLLRYCCYYFYYSRSTSV